ncbi:hypothetical protein ABSA28_00554 [Candidatus Hepatincolaceae symbiont of Richtersius coronifer]
MQINKTIRKDNKVSILGVEYPVTTLNTIAKSQSEGFLINYNHGDLFFIDNTNFFVELQSTLESLKEFLNVFAQGAVIGQGQSPVTPTPALSQTATTINLEIDKLIKKLP